MELTAKFTIKTMTPEQAREAAAVMLAFADGKKIECKTATGPDTWAEVAEPCWEWDGMKYRVAPELWEGQLWVHPKGGYLTPATALGDERVFGAGWRLITAKEVIP